MILCGVVCGWNKILHLDLSPIKCREEKLMLLLIQPDLFSKKCLFHLSFSSPPKKEKNLKHLAVFLGQER